MAKRGLTDSQWLVRGAAGIAVYVLLAILPVLFMLVPSQPEGRTFLREFSVALAFSGLALLGLQLLLSARFRRLKAPYGIDAVYHFHREISLVALALVAAHPLLLVVDDPTTVQLFAVWSAPLRSRFAVAALLLLAALVGLSYYRQRLNLSYELWRRTHGLLAVTMLAAAVAHVELVGYYVNTPLKRELWILYPLVWVVVLAWTRAVKPSILLDQPWNVVSVTPERGHAWTLRLTPSRDPMEFKPGQFVWMHLRTSPFAMAEHPFSISSSAETPGAIELTIKELGDFTSTIGQVEPGETAYIDGPYGQFSVDRHRAERYVFIAGGVGITPIMSCLRTLAHRGDRRPLTLVYGVASLDEMTFREELEDLAASPHLELVTVPARPPADWAGESGFVDEALLRRRLSAADLADAEFFVCGPEPMMRGVSASLAALGVGPERVRYELFGLV